MASASRTTAKQDGLGPGITSLAMQVDAAGKLDARIALAAPLERAPDIRVTVDGAPWATLPAQWLDPSRQALGLACSLPQGPCPANAQIGLSNARDGSPIGGAQCPSPRRSPIPTVCSRATSTTRRWRRCFPCPGWNSTAPRSPSAARTCRRSAIPPAFRSRSTRAFREVSTTRYRHRNSARITGIGRTPISPASSCASIFRPRHQDRTPSPSASKPPPRPKAARNGRIAHGSGSLPIYAASPASRPAARS